MTDQNRNTSGLKNLFKKSHLVFFAGALFLLAVLFFVFPEFFSNTISYPPREIDADQVSTPTKPLTPVLTSLNTSTYDKKLNELANNPPPKGPTTKTIKDKKTGKITTVTVPAKIALPNIWPVKTVYPNAGALLPFNRIVAYYGNLYSKHMGVLGEYSEDVMLQKLNTEVKKWEVADPSTPVVPALHYIAVVAQGSAGKDGKYRARMPSSEIDKVVKMADKIHGIVFLDIQVGLSNVQSEIPVFEKYLKLPNVHLGIDPEFSMKTGNKPGTVIGTFSASDVNFAANYLAKIVKENNLPPKILVVHRFTQGMLTNYKEIKPLPEVQIVMNMDGWGGKAKKIGTYKNFIYPQPVQFTGFKLFYKNDILTPGTSMMTPNDLLKLNPQPSYIQYQ
ncbi:MAG: hypothetical protein KGL67_03100 [Patescibacteria group bacterium]|nr:hypothetical protein [Patescibacteria group bacterium]